jgi:drug/metabolite transporter (DMT)-like permease
VTVGLCFLTQPIVSAAIGWAAYREGFTAPDAVGAVLICAALVLIRLPEGQVATKRGEAH